MPSGLGSIVIAADNEAQSICSVLAALEPLAGTVEVVVVCNGCTDDTAGLARRSARWATVLELATASKTAAMQAGDEAVSAFPRLYLDGDIVLSAAGYRALRDRLVNDGLDGVAPTAVYDVGVASRIVRSHYRWWVAAQERRTTLTGSGAIMVSAAVRGRFERWPTVIADDFYLDGLVDAQRRMRPAEVVVAVHLPRRFGDCIRRRARILQGNRDVMAAGLRPTSRGGSPATARSVVRQQPRRLLDLPAHVLVVVSAHTVAAARRRRGAAGIFYRDRSRVS